MVGSRLMQFAERVMDARAISPDDVRSLKREVLPDGIATREEADILIALERVIAARCADFDAYMIVEVVNFVVWTSRPTGNVDADKARWLIASLRAGVGPTDLALRIAFETVREAEQVDQSLTAFVMAATSEGNRRNGRPQLDLAG
jgi:hypothetical protein